MKKYEMNWNKVFRIVKICYCLHLEVLYLLNKYLGTLFNYNLISNFCQFLVVFINRTWVLVYSKYHEGIVITTFLSIIMKAYCLFLTLNTLSISIFAEIWINLKFYFTIAYMVLWKPRRNLVATSIGKYRTLSNIWDGAFGKIIYWLKVWLGPKYASGRNEAAEQVEDTNKHLTVDFTVKQKSCFVTGNDIC